MLAVAWLGGCATHGPSVEVFQVTELAAVPFFPQVEFDCGPAALATVLGASGIDTTPEALMPNVYTAGLEGSLQVELLTAARRAGRLPIRIKPSSAALFGLVGSGYPVVVLQNLRLPRTPLWHYAVVIGYEAESDRVILRSGDERRKRQRARRFATSWNLADNWGFVVTRPGTIPGGIDFDSYMRAVVESARVLSRSDLDSAYAAALSRWSDEPMVLFLGAGHAYQQRRLEDAESLYRRVLGIESDHVAARNNLANVLAEQGCYDAARREARQALALETSDGPFRDEILDTLAKLQAADSEAGSRSGCESAPNG